MLPADKVLAPKYAPRIGIETDAMAPFFVALFIGPTMVTYISSLSLWLSRAMGS